MTTAGLDRRRANNLSSGSFAVVHVGTHVLEFKSRQHNGFVVIKRTTRFETPTTMSVRSNDESFIRLSLGPERLMSDTIDSTRQETYVLHCPDLPEPQTSVICINCNCRNKGFFGNFNLAKHLQARYNGVMTILYIYLCWQWTCSKIRPLHETTQKAE